MGKGFTKGDNVRNARPMVIPSRNDGNWEPFGRHGRSWRHLETNEVIGGAQPRIPEVRLPAGSVEGRVISVHFCDHERVSVDWTDPETGANLGGGRFKEPFARWIHEDNLLLAR